MLVLEGVVVAVVAGIPALLVGETLMLRSCC